MCLYDQSRVLVTQGSIMKFKISLISSVILVSLTSVAQLGTYNGSQSTQMWGTGYWGAQQNCYGNQQQLNNALISPSNNQLGRQSSQANGQMNQSENPNLDDRNQNNSKKQIELKKLSKKRLESELETIEKKIEKKFETEVADFILHTHIEKMNQCQDYRTFPDYECFSKSTETSGVNKKTVCEGKEDVPEALRKKWTLVDQSGYCQAFARSSAGLIQTKICADESLYSKNHSTLSVTECARSLLSYRQKRIEIDKIQDEIEKLSEKSQESAREAQQAKTEGGCEECDRQGRQAQNESSNRDWWSTIGQVVGGTSLVFYGNQLDKANQEYKAQLGLGGAYGGSLNNSYNQAGYAMILSGLNGGSQSSGLSMNSQCGQNSLSGAFGYPSIVSQSSYWPSTGLLSSSSGLSNTSSSLQLQQQLQAYQQIPLSMQTPDIQSTVAQLQMRLRLMGVSLYNNSTASNYPTSGLYQNSYSNLYSNIYSNTYSNTGTVNTLLNSSLSGYSTGGR